MLTITSFNCAIGPDRFWNCECSCGHAVTVSEYDLQVYSTLSCGDKVRHSKYAELFENIRRRERAR